MQIYRCGNKRILNFLSCEVTINVGSFTSLNIILKDSDKPKYLVNNIINTIYNDKYYLAIISINEKGLFTGFGIDNSKSDGYIYLSGTALFIGTVEYYV